MPARRRSPSCNWSRPRPPCSPSVGPCGYRSRPPRAGCVRWRGRLSAHPPAPAWRNRLRPWGSRGRPCNGWSAPIWCSAAVSCCSAGGLSIGALAGGFLTAAWDWPAVFYVNVLLAGIAILAAFFVIPRDPRRQEKRSFDLPGALTVTIGATALVFALVEGPEAGWRAPSVATALALAAVLLVAFVVIEARSRDPLMPLRLFRNRSLVAGMTITFLYMGTFEALPYFLTVLFENARGLNALQTGWTFLLPSIAIAAGTQIGARLATRLSTRTTLIAGMVVGATGTVPLVPGTTAGYLALAPGPIVSGIGQGIVWTGMWIAAASGVHHDEQGVASGMASTTLSVGNAIGLAVLIALANRHTGGLEGEALRAVLAQGTQLAFCLAAAGILVSLIAAFSLPLSGSAHEEPGGAA
ncbi:MAG: MFS transporter [Paracoccus sp. (in: a-proteobacteria)]|uniref:MFS transporter n=1 Tax=Paracoccus sp. TaxID=267 RepID=UPI0039E51B7E